MFDLMADMTNILYMHIWVYLEDIRTLTGFKATVN